MTQTIRHTIPMTLRPSAIKWSLQLLGRYSTLARERRALKNLDDRLLDDIGTDRAGRDAELDRRWNAPAHWSR